MLVLSCKTVQQNETKYGRCYLFEKETPIHTNEVYPHGIDTSEYHVALCSISLEIFFSRSNDRNATMFGVKEWDVQI